MEDQLISRVEKEGISWHDFAKIFKPNITEKESHFILLNYTAWPFGGFQYNAKMMKDYFESTIVRI